MKSIFILILNVSVQSVNSFYGENLKSPVCRRVCLALFSAEADPVVKRNRRLIGNVLSVGNKCLNP